MIIAFYAIYRFYFVHVDINIKSENKNDTYLSVQQKLEDFDYLYKVLESSFPFFQVKKDMTKFDWLANKDNFRKNIAQTKNNNEFYYELQTILNRLQNKHLNIVDYNQRNDLETTYSKVDKSYPWKQILNNSVINEKYNMCKDNAYSNSAKQDLVPIKAKYFEGKYIILEKNFQIPQYSVLTKINSLNIDEYVKTLFKKIYLDYDHKRNKWFAKTLPIYSQSSDEIKLTFEYTDGKTEQKILTDYNTCKMDWNYDYEPLNIKTDIIEENKIAYLKINSFGMEHIDEDNSILIDFYSKIKDYPYLILDIRGNSGGATNYWEKNIVSPLTQKELKYKNYIAFRNSKYIRPFIIDKMTYHYIFKKKTDSLKLKNRDLTDYGYYYTAETIIKKKGNINFKGKILLLVDENVYSASESFASFCKAPKFATLIGTNTGGDGIGPDPALLVLPNSGLIIRFPMTLGINSDFTINEEMHTSPDIYIEQSLEDYKKRSVLTKTVKDIARYDTVLRKALELTR
jgi:hypothetical protein